MVTVDFRVDASAEMGSGHLMRCMTLAETLRERGASARFICREHRGHLISLLRERNLAVTVLPAPLRMEERNGGEDYAQWLGVSPDTDAKETIAALGSRKPAWLVVDHYALDSKWERLLRPHVGQLLAIDDLGREHDCDLLVDQNHFAQPESRYRSLAPPCRLLFGPRQAIIRPEYAKYRAKGRIRNGTVERILVFFGGSDPHDLTGITVRALCDAEFEHIGLDVIVGPNYPFKDELSALAAQHSRIRLHGPRPHLADLMEQADLAIGAGGATTWERLCVGVPSIVISIAENQRPICESLAQAGLICYLGSHERVDEDLIRAEVHRCIERPDELAELSSRGRITVDGLGALRVAECVIPSSASALRLRAASPTDALLFLDWVNDPAVRAQSFDSRPIVPSQHLRWFASKLASADSALKVLMAGTLAVGQIRFDRQGSAWHIDYSIDRLFRGRGWASRLVTLGMQEMLARGAAVFCAQVKESNPASAAVFRRLGFAETRAAAGTESRSYRFDSSTQRLAASS